MHLLRENLFPGDGRDQTGATNYPYTDFDDGWTEISNQSLRNLSFPTNLRTWVKVSDGSQGDVLIEWPTARSSQTIFGAMLSYADARTWPTPGSDPDGIFDAQTRSKLSATPGLDMSLPSADDASGSVTTFTDQFLHYVLHAAEVSGSPFQGSVDITADAAITQRIVWDAVDAFSPHQLVIGDEFGIDGDWPARTITETELDEDGEEDGIRWLSKRWRMHATPGTAAAIESYVGMLGGPL